MLRLSNGAHDKILSFETLSQSRSFPDPLVKGNEDSGDETVPITIVIAHTFCATIRRNYPCLPYTSGLTEQLTRLLRNHEKIIRVANKPFKTLQQEFPSPKYRQPSDLQCDVVYKIPCKNCSWNDIGETGTCFQTRKKEHQRNLKNYTKGSNVANHAWLNNHSIDF